MILTLFSLPLSTSPVWVLVLLVLLGLAALTLGGDWLTKGAVAISANFKIDPVVIGLTVVSIATSMPEMATSMMAAGDNPGLALGNILGSNIANIGLILGVAAVVAPLKIQSRMIRREVPILIIVTVLFAALALGGGFKRAEGVILLLLTCAYLIYVVCSAKQQDSPVVAEEFAEGAAQVRRLSSLAGMGFVVLGAVSLALGADFLVGSSVEIASRLGVSDLFIGLSIVAIGTSLPELAASVAAVRAGHGDLCAGNIVGSNLFNMLLIGGGVSVFVGMNVTDTLLLIEFPALVLLSVLLWWIFKSGRTVTRCEGVLLLFLYLTILSVSGLSQFGFLF